MSLLLVLPSALAAITGVLATAGHRRMHPSWAAQLLVVTIAAVGLAVVPALVGVAVVYLAHVPVLDGALAWCSEAIGVHVPIPGWLGLTAVAVLAFGIVRLGLVRRSWRQFHSAFHGDVEVLTNDALFAYTLPGAGGHIVLSSGLVDELDGDELAVVVAHEQSHARHRHDRYLLVGELVNAVVPVLQPLQRRLRFVLERWADEEAVDQLGVDRRMFARTLARVALSNAPTPPLVLGAAGLGAAGRVDALLDPPPLHRARWWAGTTSVGVAAVIAAGAVQMHHVLPLLMSLCPG